MNWLYENKEVDEAAIGAIGFVYELVLSDGTRYVGQKTFMSTISKLPLKSGEMRDGHIEFYNKNVMLHPDTGKIVVARKDKAALRKLGIKATRETYERIQVESKWQDYLGSSEFVDPNLVIHKRILEWIPTERSKLYLEEKWQFIKEVLESEVYLNKQIGNRYFKGKLL